MSSVSSDEAKLALEKDRLEDAERGLTELAKGIVKGKGTKAQYQEFTRDSSTHYYSGPIELDYPDRTGRDTFSMV